MNEKKLNLLFKAFADPNRLRILHILTHGERCVCDLMAVLKMGQSKVSRHLAFLRRAELVKARREGLWIHYSLKKAGSAAHKKLLACLASCLDAPVFGRDMDFLEKLAKNKKDLREKKGCSI